MVEPLLSDHLATTSWHRVATLPGDTAVEINADISITATNVVELYRSPWQGPIALVIHHDPNRRRIGLVRVEQP